MPPIYWKNGRFIMAYLVLMALPFAATFALDMQDKTAYAAFLSLFNTLAIMVFYIQFSLVSRLKHLAPFSNINWSMALHRKIGQWLGVIFLLHPFLILAPRFFVSFNDGIESVVTTITAPSAASQCAMSKSLYTLCLSTRYCRCGTNSTSK